MCSKAAQRSTTQRSKWSARDARSELAHSAPQLALTFLQTHARAVSCRAAAHASTCVCASSTRLHATHARRLLCRATPRSAAPEAQRPLVYCTVERGCAHITSLRNLSAQIHSVHHRPHLATYHRAAPHSYERHRAAPIPLAR